MRQAGGKADRQVGRKVVRQRAGEENSQSDKEAGRYTYREMDRKPIVVQRQKFAYQDQQC